MDRDKWDSGQCSVAWEEINNRHYPSERCEVDGVTTRLELRVNYPLIYEMPEHLREPFFEESIKTGIPYTVAANLIGSESNFRAKVISPTGALGLAQMVSGDSGPLYRRLSEIAHDLPEEAQRLVEDNIEKYNAAPEGEKFIWKYRIKEGGDEAAVKALAQDEEIAIKTGYKHMLFSIKEGSRVYEHRLKDRIKWMEHNYTQRYEEILDSAREENAKLDLTTEEGREKSWALLDRTNDKLDELHSTLGVRLDAMHAEINRPMTAADLKIFYLCGATGGAGFLEALADPVKRQHNHRAADYASTKTVESNAQLFYKDYPRNTIYRDVEEFYEHVVGLVGEMSIPVELTSNGVNAEDGLEQQEIESAPALVKPK